MRKIEQKMFDYIDDKLAKNGLAQNAVEMNDSRLLFICAMESCVGIYESGGNNKGPMVSLIQETVGGPDHVAWCMSLVQTGLAYVEKKLKVTSPIFESEHCLTVWDKTSKKQRVKFSPKPGAIVIWQKGKTMSGHTGIVKEFGLESMLTIEGNTGPDTKAGLNRDGDGVYLKSRNKAGTKAMRVVGFLKPF